MILRKEKGPRNLVVLKRRRLKGAVWDPLF